LTEIEQGMQGAGWIPDGAYKLDATCKRRNLLQLSVGLEQPGRTWLSGIQVLSDEPSTACVRAYLVDVFEIITFPVHTQQMAHKLQYGRSRFRVRHNVHVTLVVSDAGFNFQALGRFPMHGHRGCATDNVMYAFYKRSVHYWKTPL
jgi:hypothetical protein